MHSAFGSSDDASELPEVDEEDPNAECKSACAAKVGPCKKQCVNDYPDTLDDWNAMCEEGMGVFGSMPSVEVCKERGEGEYSCGENGPCTQSPQGNCKGRCEDEVPRCMEECDCEGDDCPNPGKACKAACNENGGYQQRAAARHHSGRATLARARTSATASKTLPPTRTRHHPRTMVPQTMPASFPKWMRRIQTQNASPRAQPKWDPARSSA